MLSKCSSKQNLLVPRKTHSLKVGDFALRWQASASDILGKTPFCVHVKGKSRNYFWYVNVKIYFSCKELGDQMRYSQQQSFKSG